MICHIYLYFIKTYQFYKNSMWKHGLVLLLFFQLFTFVHCKKVDDDINTKQEEDSHIEVTSVFIKCEPDERNDEATRFEREQLFKHSALKNCNKKLAVTVKVTSKPNEHSGDEYIPLEHVFDGASKRRVRLLNPYILRMHWSPPLQAYKLHRTDTVAGVLSSTNSQEFEQNDEYFEKNRNEREAKYLPDDILKFNMNSSHLFRRKQDSSIHRKFVQKPPNPVIQDFKCDNNGINNSLTLPKREKRHEQSSLSDKIYDENIVNILPWNNHPQQSLIEYSTSGINEEKNSKKQTHVTTLTSYYRELFASSKRNKIHQKQRDPINSTNGYPKTMKLEHEVYVYDTTETDFSKKHKYSNINSNKHLKKRIKIDKKSNNASETVSSEREFALYDIGKPDLWYRFNVQLYEKLTTNEGKTIWNDLTRGKIASVSSSNPEWTDHDSTNVRYRPVQWLSKEEFALPSTSLCLLESLHNTDSNDFPDGNSNKEYIVVPLDDVIGVQSDRRNVYKRHEDYTNGTTTSEIENKKDCRRVVVRLSRALLRNLVEDMNIVNQESDQYLTFPHQRPYQAQIDLEVRADDNQLVCVGSAGRIATVVTDSTRQARSILTVHATNMGLAAARFRVVVRDCGPELSKVIDDSKKDESSTGSVLLPPRHTRRLHLVLSLEIPNDLTHCLVALVNDADESIAVRDVTIKRGDRCFCVWHCDCVCLSEDPRLLCREMSESLQKAAGLSPRDRLRQTRSACYEDVITLNIFVVVMGVLIALLFLGLVKAFVGLFCRSIAVAGLHKLIQMPRKLDRYYEDSLSSRRVVYDCDGWPIHPDTKKRTVRLISRSMEFMLNLIYFVTIPCLATRDLIMHVTTSCKTDRNKIHCTSPNMDTAKDCYSSHDSQNLKPRWERGRSELRKWMTTQAQELSADLWRKGLTPLESPSGDIMQPLLQESRHRSKSREHVVSSCVDSEQDDTEYVLMQMQKSRESLVRCHKKPNDVETSSVRNQKNGDCSSK